MKYKNLKILGIRPPEIDLTLKNFDDITEPVSVAPRRALVPNLSLFYVGKIIKDELKRLGYETDISIYDMAASNPTKLSEYSPEFMQNSELKYGSGTVNKKLRGESLDTLKDKVKDIDVCYLSAQFSAGASAVAQTINAVKKYNSEAIILVGGRDAQYRSEWYIKQGADAVFLGQAENLSGITIDSLINNKEMSFPGIATKSLHGNLGQKISIDKSFLQLQGVNSMKKFARQISRNADLSQEVLPIFDKNILSLYSESCDGLLPKDVSTPIMWYTTSVGCPEHCTFCPTAGNPYFSLSSERVERMFEHYKKNGIRTLLSAEDNFLARLRNPGEKDAEKEITEIMNLMLEYGFAHEFSNGLEVKLLMGSDNKIRKNLIENIFAHKKTETGYVGTYRMYWPIETLLNRERLNKLSDKKKHYEILDAVLQTEIPEIIFNSILFTDYGSTEIELLRRELGDFCEWMQKHQRKTKWSIPIFHELPLAGAPAYKKLISKSLDIEKHSELWAVPINPVNGLHYKYDELYSIKRKLMKEFDPEGLKEWDTAGRYGTSEHIN